MVPSPDGDPLVVERIPDLFGGEPVEDEATQALFRATRNLTADDKEQVVRFAEFLKGSGQAPARRRSQ